MRKNFFSLAAIAAMALALTAGAWAGTIDFTANGTYSGTVPSDPTLFLANTNFSFNFAEPSDLTNLNQPNTPVIYTLDGQSSLAGVGDVTFYDLSTSGLFDIAFDNYTWEFFGPQIFTTLPSGDFALETGVFDFSGDELAIGQGSGTGPTTSGTITATPEPASLALLGAGLLLLGGASLKRRAV